MMRRLRKPLLQSLLSVHEEDFYWLRTRKWGGICASQKSILCRNGRISRGLVDNLILLRRKRHFLQSSVDDDTSAKPAQSRYHMKRYLQKLSDVLSVKYISSL